ncbi:hypothetical protein NDU88_004572 [Pleurodeles waltl]|uniref:Uncharacterized protein n=1 Tax=Pleurodeles waltl TaxID=8319 RepID=A0AAV7W5C9_PLEWA|nr:hypothetical protein NDU88_004572 [Pleurodeles waltl]
MVSKLRAVPSVSRSMVRRSTDLCGLTCEGCKPANSSLILPSTDDEWGHQCTFRAAQKKDLNLAKARVQAAMDNQSQHPSTMGHLNKQLPPPPALQQWNRKIWTRRQGHCNEVTWAPTVRRRHFVNDTEILANNVAKRQMLGQY